MTKKTQVELKYFNANSFRGLFLDLVYQNNVHCVVNIVHYAQYMVHQSSTYFQIIFSNMTFRQSHNFVSAHHIAIH